MAWLVQGEVLVAVAEIQELGEVFLQEICLLGEVGILGVEA